MGNIKLVLDSNEYVFYFDNKNDILLKLLNLPNIKIYLNSLIFREVLRNMRKESIKYLINLIKNPKFVTNSEKIPKSLIEKYKKLGLKKGDVVVAAFSEYVKADYLITENRHFLKAMKFDEFEVLGVKEFLNKVVKT